MNNAMVSYLNRHQWLRMLRSSLRLLLGSPLYMLHRDWARAMFLEHFFEYQWSGPALFDNVDDYLTSPVYCVSIWLFKGVLECK